MESMMNQLDQATSLFLRQHKDNPVAWRLWSPEVLAEAQAQDKPILLSVGYTACHWCHAMNLESFADAETARLINENFIPVLADREERPDLDQVYQTASQVMGHSGGWPLNMFLTPEAKPFFATGFLPREERLGQPACAKVVARYGGDVSRPSATKLPQNSTGIMRQLENTNGRDTRT